MRAILPQLNLKHRIILITVSILLLSVLAESSYASWEPSRNAQNQVVVNALGQSEAFDYELSNQQILTGFSVGHDIPRTTNHLFYNLELDGYGGLPFGSCLRRGYLLPDSDPNKELCTANENKDLMRVWGNRNPDLQHVLLKNMTIKNAFRTYNVVDGDVVQNSRALPHTDTFQAFYSGSAQEDPQWLAIQDSVIKNSDNSLMIFSTRFAGILYQNLITACEAEFVQDGQQRILNDHAEFTGNTNPSLFVCGNNTTVGTSKAAPVWLVNVLPSSGAGRIGVTNENARVVVVGNQEGDYRITTRDANRRVVPHPNVRYYPNIEAALAAESSRPPFMELSCAGWATPPANCEDRRGFLDNGDDPIDTGDESDDDDGAGDPDGSDRPDDPNPTGDNSPNTNASPVAHWRLDETSGAVATNSASTINGRLRSMATNQWNRTNPRVGRSSLRFDGGDERVSIGNIDFGASQISFMGWVRPTDILAVNGEGRILSKANGTGEQDHYWMLSADENGSGIIVPRVRLKAGNRTKTLLGGNSSELINGRWAHLAATYDGEALRLYHNGVEVGATPLQGNVAANAAVQAAIGNQPNGGRGFVGLIDDVCIFSVAIAPREVRELYNAGAGRSCDRLAANGPPASPPTPEDKLGFMPSIYILLGDDD